MSDHTTRRYPGKTLQEKFWLYTDVGPFAECWLWHGPTDCDEGYGRLYITRHKFIYAHRLSYELHFGPVPDGLDILHSCDCRLCVNPYHLRPGTHLENMQDMIERGHLVLAPPPRGESNHNAKLTEKDVVEIRAMCELGICRKDIAAKFGVNPQTITKIVLRQRWKHVP